MEPRKLTAITQQKLWAWTARTRVMLLMATSLFDILRFMPTCLLIDWPIVELHLIETEKHGSSDSCQHYKFGFPFFNSWVRFVIDVQKEVNTTNVGGFQAHKFLAFGRKSRWFEPSNSWSTSPLDSHLMAAPPPLFLKNDIYSRLSNKES